MCARSFEHDITELLRSRDWGRKTPSEIDVDVQTIIFAAVRVHMTWTEPGYAMGRVTPPPRPFSAILARCYGASIGCEEQAMGAAGVHVHPGAVEAREA